jgi:hypothetical protein
MASISGANSFARVVFPTPGRPQTITINNWQMISSLLKKI